MDAAGERAPADRSAAEAHGPAGTSRSSPTETAAGRARTACRSNDGHSAGADTVKARLRDAVELGIEELTVYSFSTENWSRPARGGAAA